MHRQAIPRTLGMLIAAMQARGAWAQCAMCQASLAGAENGDKVISGFQQGIIFLLVVVGIICFLVLRTLRNARKQAAARGANEEEFKPVPAVSLTADR